MSKNKGNHENSLGFTGKRLVTLFHRFSYFGVSPCLSVLFSLCVSGELIASGQHRVQCSWPEGPAAAWQGMTLITALFLPSDCQPTLSALHHPCAALYTIIQLGIPSRPAFKTTLIIADALYVS